MQKQIAADSGKYVAGDVAKVNDAIEKVTSRIADCNSLDCKLIINVFMSKLPQSVGHAAKSGEFIAGGKMEKVFAEGYSFKGKKLDQIKAMKLPHYLDTHINRIPAFGRVMKAAGLDAYTKGIVNGPRKNLLDKDPNAMNWTVKPEGNVLMFNANMTPGVDEFNLIPPGEAMIAYVGAERMVEGVNDPSLQDAMLQKLKDAQYG